MEVTVLTPEEVAQATQNETTTPQQQVRRWIQLPSNHHPLQSKNETLMIVCSVVLGVVASLFGLGLTKLIYFIVNIAFFGQFSVEKREAMDTHLGAWVIPIPIIGGLIVGLLAHYGQPAIRGHGIPEAMESILHKHSKIPTSMLLLKPLSAAIAIGTGSPFGAEGPIIATGGALGSLLGQVMKTTDNERKILLSVGAASGMSATFGTPLASILLAMELLLSEYTPIALISVSLGSFAAAIVRHLFYDGGAFFPVTPIDVPEKPSFILYVFIGLVTGIIGSIISRLLFWLEDQWPKIRIPDIWHPALGAIIVGVVGYFVPRTLSVGYSNISDISSNTLPMHEVAILSFAKFASWIISLSSGTSGGTLAPLLTIGSGVGCMLTWILREIFAFHLNYTVGALVGMGALFTGSSRAFLATTVFVIESTQLIHSLTPVVGGCAAALWMSWLLMRHSIMTEKIARKGRAVIEGYSADFFHEGIVVSDIMHQATNIYTVHYQTSVQQVISQINGTSDGIIPVVDDNMKILGTVLKTDVLNANTNAPINTLLTKTTPVVHPNTKLQEVVEAMILFEIDAIPVVDHQFTVVSILSQRHLSMCFKKWLTEQQLAQRQEDLKDNWVVRFIQRLTHINKVKYEFADDTLYTPTTT